MTIKRYDSLTEFAQHVAKLEERNRKQDDNNSYCGNAEWCGGTFEEAFNLVNFGWAEGSAKASEIVGRIADRTVGATGNSVDMAIGFDVCGAAYDPGAYLSGVPECWGTIQPQLSKRAVRIVIDLAASGAISADIIERRGLAAMALVLALHSRGYPVTVDVCDLCEDGPKPGYPDIMVRVADASSGAPLDIDRMAYALSHPTMLRRLFAAAVNGYKYGLIGGEPTVWGRAHPLRKDPPPARIDSPDIYIGGAHLNDVQRWEDGGEAWVLAEFERQTKVG